MKHIIIILLAVTAADCSAAIIVTPSSLDLYPDPNDPMHAFAELHVYSDSTEMLFTADPNKTSVWLSIEPDSGLAPTDPNDAAIVTVSATTSGLPPGTYSNTIFFLSDPNAQTSEEINSTAAQNVAVPITLNVPAPILEVTSDPLDFYYDAANPADPNTLTEVAITVTNTGPGQLNWIATEPNKTSPWLNFSPASGTLDSDPNAFDTIIVTVNTTDTPIGSYSSYIQIADPYALNSPQVLPVTFEVNQTLPVMEVIPSELTFSANPDDEPVTRSFTLSSSSTTSHTWYIDPNSLPSWLTVSPDSGTVSQSSHQLISLTADPANLQPGTYGTSFTVSSPHTANAPVLSVTFNVQDVSHELAVLPEQISIDANVDDPPISESATLSTTGTTDLNWYIDPNSLPAWLTVSPQSGIVNGSPQSIVLTANPLYMPPGTGTYSLLIYAPSAVNSPLSLAINYNISPSQPYISLSADEFTFTNHPDPPPPQTLTITNTGQGKLDWQIDSAALPAWLTIDPLSGTLSASDSEPVTITANTQGLPADIYTSTFEVSDPDALNSPQVVTVRLITSDEIFVPEDFPTIQAAIDASRNEDTILLAPGTYTGPGNTHVDFSGKAVTVKPRSEPYSSTIDCAHQDCAFVFISGETADSVIEGLNIINGRSLYQDIYAPGDKNGDGGAVYCYLSSPTIRNCIFYNCYAELRGGAIYARLASPSVTDCTFSNNYADQGAGICSSDGPVERCTFINNTAAVYGGAVGLHFGPIRSSRFHSNSAFKGGAIAYAYDEITNCLITGNSAEYGGAIYYSPAEIINSTIVANTAFIGGGIADSNARIVNSILYYNTAEYGSQFYDSSQPVNSCIENFSQIGTSNISAEPDFTQISSPDPAQWDYSILPSSPCIDAGLTIAPNVPSDDFVSNLRPLDGNGDTQAAVDIGAFEYIPPSDPTAQVAPLYFSFTAYPDVAQPLSADLRIANLGPGSISWQIDPNSLPTWLNAEPLSGTVSQPPAIVALTVNPLSMPDEAYQANVTLDLQTEVEPLTVPVHLRVGPIQVPAHYSDIASAVAAAHPGNTILVSPGTYSGSENTNINFEGKPLVLRSTDGPLVTILDCQNTARAFVFNTGETSDCVVDGFTIINASAEKGAAVYCADFEQPAFKNSIFTANSASKGGAIFGHAGEISHCTFDNNTADCGAALASCTGTVQNSVFSGNTAMQSGGAISDSNLEIAGCDFNSNVANIVGAAIANSQLTITDTMFTANSAPSGAAIANSLANLHSCTFSTNSSEFGGAIACTQGHADQCLFIQNSAASLGGGIYASSLAMTNCLFNQNTASRGAALANFNGHLNNVTIAGNYADLGPGLYLMYSQPVVTNSIIWNNFAKFGGPISIASHSKPTIAYSDIQHGQPQIDHTATNSGLVYLDTNFASDPFFADPINNDFHLLSSFGRYNPNTAAWNYDSVTSPCIDAGNPDANYYNEPWPNGARLNLGYYGNTSEASKSSFPNDFCPDLNGDNFIDLIDLAIFAADYNAWPANPTAPYTCDFNSDATVDLTDLFILANYWLTSN